MFRYLLVLSFIFFSCCSSAATSSCDAIEIIEGQERYNELVCSGITYFQLGHL